MLGATAQSKLPKPARQSLCSCDLLRRTKDTQGDQHGRLSADNVAQTPVDRRKAADGQHAADQSVNGTACVWMSGEVGQRAERPSAKRTTRSRAKKPGSLP